MSTAGGPKLHGIGRSGDSDIVLCMDAHDAGSYGGEATVNLFPQPSLASSAVGTTWSGANGTWGTSTATVESVMGPDGKYIKAVSNRHSASGGGTANIWFYYNYLSGMGSAQRDLTLTNGTAYTCSWWWKANESRTATSNNIYFVGVANVSTGGSNTVTTEWTKASISFTFGGTTGSYNPAHYFYGVGDSTAVGFKVWYAMLQIEEKTYATPTVRNQLSGFGQQGYNARPVSVNLMIHGDVGSGQSFSDSSPSKHTITTVGNTTHSTAQSKFSGGSIYFDGSDNLIAAASTDWAFGTGSFTVDCWLYKLATVSWETCVESYTQSGGNNGFICGLKSTDSTIAFYSEGGTGWSYAGGTALSLNTWYHLAWVRSGNNLRMFVNGVQQGSSFTLSASDNLSAAAFINIGSRTGDQYINGYMDEVRITKGTALWTSAFTPPTRRNNNGPLVDLSGSNNGGNFNTDDMTDVSTYRVGQVIEPVASAVWDFDGTDDSINGGKGCRVGNTRRKSIEAWVRGVTSGTKTLLFMGDHANNYKWQWTTIGGGQYMTGSGYGTRYYWPDGYLTAAGWHHWVDVVDEDQGAGDRVKRYVDGVLLTPNALTTDTGDSFYDGTDMYVDIGMAELGSGPYGLFDGEIGAVRLYRTALSHNQVKQNFNSQRSRFQV